MRIKRKGKYKDNKNTADVNSQHFHFGQGRGKYTVKWKAGQVVAECVGLNSPNSAIILLPEARR